MKFSILFPHLRPWVLGLAHVWPATIIKPNFAIWEVFHILSLVLLGGGAILVGLRLAGAGLKDEPPSAVYRGLAPILVTGVVGVVVTGRSLPQDASALPSPRLAAVVGGLTVLVWVTAAAAGRWIAFA